MSEKELITEIKKTLTKIANNNSTWKLILGRESLTAADVMKRLDNDRKLRKFLVKHYVGLAVELEQKAREKLFGRD
jgi:hypothetical protein